MTTTEIQNMQDGDQIEMEGGVLTCMDDYRGWFRWDSSDHYGAEFGPLDLIQARDGRWNLGYWQEDSACYISGHSTQRSRFPRGIYKSPQAAIRQKKGLVDKMYA